MVKKAKLTVEMPKTAADISILATDMERFYFLFALGAALIAGELVWWQAKTANDYLIEYDAAAIYSTVSNRDKRDLLRIEAELEVMQAELEQFIQEENVVPQ